MERTLYVLKTWLKYKNIWHYNVKSEDMLQITFITISESLLKLKT